MTESSATTAPVAGNQAVLARRYVNALYSLATQEGQVDAVAADLRSLRILWNESAEWRFVACDPRPGPKMAAKAVELVAKNSSMGKLTSNFLSVLAQNRRLKLLPALIDGFMDEVATHRGEHRAVIRTARPLTAAQSEALTSSLAGVAGGNIRLTVIEDASLLGGITIKLGTKFIDASVKTKLDQLERTLKGAA